MKRFLLPLLVLTLLVAPAAADETSDRLDRLEKMLLETRTQLAELRAAGTAPAPSVSELEQKIDVLTKEIEAMKVGGGSPASAAPDVTMTKAGLAPAASKVYSATGATIGGYGEILFQDYAGERENDIPVDRDSVIDMYRAIFYFGYHFDAPFVFNSEIEYEHARVVSGENDGGEIAVEFATIDWLASPQANLRAGLLLVPMGFVNELHEPPVFLGSLRPDVERSLIPSTWRELGFGGWGDAGPITWRAYLVNSLDSDGFRATDGIRAGRQSGNRAKVNDWAFTGRVDFTAVPGLLAGVSFFGGNTDQGRQTPAGEKFDARTTVWDLHAEYRAAGFHARALFVGSRITDAEEVNLANNLAGANGVGSRQGGWYVEAGYDVLSLLGSGKASLVGFARYETLNTQKSVPDGWTPNKANDRENLTVGLSYRPIPQIVLKTDYQFRRNEAETGLDQWNVSLGWMF